MFDSSNFVYFVNTRKYSKAYGFSTYMDKDGIIKMIVNSYDPISGQPVPRRFKFSKRDRVMRIPVNQKDVAGNSVVEFLKNHPECEGSPNSNGLPSIFKVMDADADAKVANKAKANRIKAENIALGLEGKELEEIAASFGVTNMTESLLQHRMLELAGNDPDVFLEVYNAPDRKMRALIHSGLSSGVLTQRGELIMWETTVVGSNFDKAISTLTEDKKLAKAVAEAIERYK